MNYYMENEQSNNMNNNMNRDMGECQGRIHVIESGDTLYLLSRKYDVKIADIMRNNPYMNVYNLQIGDEICIPTGTQIQEGQLERTYIVQEGDTLRDILNIFNTDYETLAKYNSNIADLPVPVGFALRMPVSERPSMIQPR